MNKLLESIIGIVVGVGLLWAINGGHRAYEAIEIEEYYSSKPAIIRYNYLKVKERVLHSSLNNLNSFSYHLDYSHNPNDSHSPAPEKKLEVRVKKAVEETKKETEEEIRDIERELLPMEQHPEVLMRQEEWNENFDRFLNPFHHLFK